MGADGGSIPRRTEMVKTKSKAETADKDELNLEKWNLCSLTMEPLVRPVVACRLGKLYNKESVLSWLLASKTTTGEPDAVQEAFSHIKSLKDLKELNLTDNPAFAGAKAAGSARFICPITGKEMNGNFKFFYYKPCGCVMSEQALKEVKQEKGACLKCGREVEQERDMVPINGTAEEVERLRKELLLERQSKSKKSKSSNSSSSTKRQLEVSTQLPSGEILALKRTKTIDELYTKNN